MRLTSITMPWADGEYTFDLRLGEVRKLQLQTGLGPPVILFELQNDRWKVDHIRETILQGLLGGGMKVEQARSLVVKWVDNRPARENLLVAQVIILAWINGAPEPKKVPAVDSNQETTMAPDVLTSPQSTEQVPLSDLVPET
jgi:hypothetical protein